MSGLDRLRRTGAFAVAVVAATTLAAPTWAACGVTPEAVAQAEVAFVGSLTDVSADGAQATFKIEEVWRGPGLSAGGSSPNVFASPGTFQMPPAGAPAFRYLILAHTAGGRLVTGDECRLFPFPWDDSYAAFRPVDTPLPSDAPGPTGGEGGPPGAVLVAAAALVVLGVVGVFAFRRESG